MNYPRLSRLSVVVPCYNEELGIRETHSRLSRTLGALGSEYEIIYINDGSRDDTFGALREIQKDDPHVRVVDLARNFGHQLAVTAGVDLADGDAVVLIDADLQDPPELIPQMLEKWREGFDVVYGQRGERKGETAFKRTTAKAFYRLLDRLSEVRMPLDTGDFRLMDRRVVDALKSMPERDRFIRGMVSWIGFRQTGIRYERDARFAGESNYPLKKMIAFATDGLISFSTKPLKMASAVGFASGGLAVLGILYVLVIRLFTASWVSGWAMMMIVLLFFSGVQLLCLGIIGEYVGRTYQQTKGRPLYLVREVLGQPGDAQMIELPIGRS